MGQGLENTIALLERTPAALDALLRGLPEVWTESNEGGNTWSVSTVVAHLIHCENENWMPRARHILHADQTQPFPPFDREGHVRYKGGKTLPQLLDEFARARAKGLEELRATAVDAARIWSGGHGIRHSARSLCLSCWPRGRRTI